MSQQLTTSMSIGSKQQAKMPSRGERPSSRTRSALGVPIKQRDMRAEAAEYLPRQCCHHSLPPGKVACRLHEALRLAGTVPFDTGPASSD